MVINIIIEKAGNESNANVLRRFTKRVQNSGILRKKRKIRYSKRNESKFKRKTRALKTLAREEELAELFKLGKMPKDSRK